MKRAGLTELLPQEREEAGKPPPEAEAFAKDIEDVEPFAFAEAEKIIATELGVRLSKRATTWICFSASSAGR